MRSRSVLISTSFKAWTVNPEQLVRLRKVWRRRTLNICRFQIRNAGWWLTHDPTGCFHVGFCQNITGTSASPFDTESWGIYVWMHVCACMFVPVCLTSCCAFFLFMIGGVSARLLLIHHPAATGLSCDWTQHTLPPANMICRPKLDSYRLWQGYRAVWHNITHTLVCLDEFTVLTYAKTETHPTALHPLCLNLKNRN